MRIAGAVPGSITPELCVERLAHLRLLAKGHDWLIRLVQGQLLRRARGGIARHGWMMVLLSKNTFRMPSQCVVEGLLG